MQIIENNREVREAMGQDYNPPKDLQRKKSSEEPKSVTAGGEKSIEFVEESMGNDYNEDMYQS